MASTSLAILFAVATQAFHLPPKLIDSVCFVESSYRVNVVHRDDGTQNSLGVCEIQLRTARWLGYQGNEKDLMSPGDNVYYAAKYLSYQINRYHSVSKGIAAYNAGSYRQRQGVPINSSYVIKVRKAWNALNQGKKP